MIALTKEKREELIGNYTKYIEWCNKRLSSSLNDFDRGAIESSKLTTEIALASLTAEPVAYTTYKGNLLHAGDPKLSEYSDPEPLYDAPPVPEIKDHQIREMVTEITNTAKKYQGCQCLRDAISKVVIKRLNGLGE